MYPRPPFVPAPRHLVLVLLLLVACMVLGELRFAAPGSTASGGDPERVRANLAMLLGDGTPHPVGSAGHAEVRDRLLAAWRELAIEPEVQSGWVAAAGRFVQVENVIAVLPGVATQKPSPNAPLFVMLAAHYDSVPAGPGASDDMVGVAVQLEVARVLKAQPGPRPSFVFLTTDGEELGLHGARLFCAKHPLRDRITRFVNLEARGTSGPSLLFEAALPSGQALMSYAEQAARPLTSSLFVRAYQQMPNDTDFTVFRRELNGMGFNFACVGGVQHYHTPLDALANVASRTLLHQLDNALAALRALARAPQVGSKVAAEELLWIDLAGYCALGVTRRFGELSAILGLGLTVGGVVSRIRRRRLSMRQALLGFGLVILAIVIAVGVGFGFHRVLLASGSIPARFVANLRPIALTSVGIAIATAMLVGGLGAWRAGFMGLAAGLQLFWSALVMVAILIERFVALPVRGTELLPVLVPPVLLMGCLGMASAVAPRVAAFAHLAVVVPAGVATILLAPITFALLETLGVAWLPLEAALLALAFVGIAPYAGLAGAKRYWFPLLAFLLTLGCAIAALKLAPFTPFLPKGSSIVLVQEEGGTKWIGAHLPKPQPPVVEATFAEPELTVLEDLADGAGRLLTVRLRSPRGASRIVLRFDEAVCEGARVGTDEVAVMKLPTKAFAIETLPAQGVEVQLRLPLAGLVSAVLEDVTFDLPAAGASVRAARPQWAVPIQDGDRTVVRRKVTF